MTTTSKSVETERRSLLDQIAAITTMQSGTLAEEYRERPNPEGSGTKRLGPYFKHQVWQDGRNLSRRVPADEAVLLREDIDNAKLFERLTGELARLNIEHTLALRASPSQNADSAEGKKTPNGNGPRKIRRNGSLRRASKGDLE